MSPRETNLKTQRRWHGPVLWLLALGIAAFVIGGLVLMQTPVVPDPEVDAAPTVEDG